MSQDPFNFDVALEELRTVGPAGDPDLTAARMQAKVADALRHSGANKMRTRILRYGIATLAAAVIAGAALLAPRESFASNLKKVAKAFQSTTSYHVRSYATLDGVKRLNSETWVDSGKIRTRLYDESGTAIDLPEIGVVAGSISLTGVSGNAPGAKNSIVLRPEDSSTGHGPLTVIRTGDPVKDRDLQAKISKFIASLDPNDPLYQQKLSKGLSSITGQPVSSESKQVTVHMDGSSNAGDPTVRIDSSGKDKRLQFANIQYSVGSLKKMLENTAGWLGEPAKKVNGELIEHYRSVTNRMELDVDARTSLPRRLKSVVTVNGNPIPTEDDYDYPAQIKP